jgi:hypothetical protein
VIYVAMVLQWLHMLFAIAWFGSSIFVTFVLIPATRRLSAAALADFFKAFGQPRFFAVVGGLTVVFGILRGLVLGITPGSTYGVTFIAALVLGVALTFWGARMTGPNVVRLAEAAVGAPQAAAIATAVRSGYVELGGFAVLLALMAAMRFGY